MQSMTRAILSTQKKKISRRKNNLFDQLKDMPDDLHIMANDKWRVASDLFPLATYHSPFFTVDSLILPAIHASWQFVFSLQAALSTKTTMSSMVSFILKKHICR